MSSRKQMQAHAVREENERLHRHIIDLEEKLIAAVKIIQEREDICNDANETIAMCKKRIADLEAENERLQRESNRLDTVIDHLERQ